MTGTTARDLLAQLRRHYIPDEKVPAGIFAPEVQAPGKSARRADLVFQGCTAATGSQLIGHEIKGSRSDLAAELTDLTKSHPWQRYCDRWWLVVPNEHFADGFDLPDTWGVLAPPSGRRTRTMTVQRPAPRLDPDEQAPALRALASWQHWQLRDAGVRLAEEKKHRERAEDHARQLRERADDQAARALSPHRQRLHDAVEQIVRRLGGPGPGSPDVVGSWDREIPVDMIVAELQEAGRARRQTAQLSRQVEHHGERLRHVLEGVDRGSLAALLDDVKATAL